MAPDALELWTREQEFLSASFVNLFRDSDSDNLPDFKRTEGSRDPNEPFRYRFSA